MLIASNDVEKLLDVKNKLSNEFEMTDLGDPKSFLGINVKRNREKRIMNTK